MSVGNVFHAFDHDYELYVEETSGRSYLLVMNGYNGAGPIVLHAYTQRDEAIAAAQAFPKLFRTAQQRGFQFNDPFFEHPSGKSVHVSFALQPGTTPDKFMKVLTII